MADQLRALAAEARKRAVGSILGYVENAPWWERLTLGEQCAYRDKVISSINAYHDVALDMIKVSRVGTVVNEETLRIVQQVHAAAQRIEEKVT